MNSLFYYSYLNASIGSSFDALLAGYIPKNMPTADEKRKAMSTVNTDTPGATFKIDPIA